MKVIFRNKKGLKRILLKLNLIIQNQNAMNQDLQAIKSDLITTKEKLTKIDADVTRLYDRINSITGELPTAAEWAEVKQLAGEARSQATAIDERTAEETENKG